MEKLIDVTCYPVVLVLNRLLQDKSNRQNIIWATDTYAPCNTRFRDKSPLEARALLRHPDIIRPRIQKSQETQAERTRKKAEVFTPAWLCNRMNNALDTDWFGRPNVFNTENADATWMPTSEKISFPPGKTWQDYIISPRLEITCGEAPFLVSRYDVATGELIAPPKRRIGLLDRKLRIVNENATDSEWLPWAIRAFESTYGYEYQGDNVLLARINLLMTFCDYYEERFWEPPAGQLLKKIADIVAWNIWQMDGLQDTPPLGQPYARQSSLFAEDPGAAPCQIFNWRKNAALLFMEIKGGRIMGEKLFDYVIGNPPYQEDKEDNGRKPPVYHTFLDASYKIANVAEFITPARFLFDAGHTPKAWNRKMLADEHFTVLYYESDGSKIFPNAEIKGGIAITLRDDNKNYGKIGTFTPYPALNAIAKKVSTIEKDQPHLDSIISSQGIYRFSDKAFVKFPDIRDQKGAGTGNKIVSTDLEKFPEIFLKQEPTQGEYIKIWGRTVQGRVYKFVQRDNIQENEYIDTYNVILPESNGNGAFETLSTPLVAEPLTGSADTFISMGTFDNKDDAEHCLAYIKTKFARAMLGIKKVTQHNPKATWEFVPLQDFTAASDIDWSKSIHDIDLQLYRKYGLDEKEIEFIEKHVKEMG
ncbi:MAG: Eco57I restriction-modification methylase domain-containing protein [Selenomonadaceae bacterium]|nr:Eco57I restriction-modification methylase domain-containing protein [Selenomonadaceae bacterium]